MHQWNSAITATAATFRSRLGIQDAIILAAALCAATLFALEYDFFESLDHMSSREKRITVLEFFALSGVLIAGLIVFAFRRLQQQKQEFLRRLAAEGDARTARDQAISDPLTGLPNRRALLQTMTGAIADSTGASSHALVLLDLNGFKAINDRFGHPVGDQVLEAVAQRLQSIACDDFLVARLGGDEFAVFCRSVRNVEEVHRLTMALIVSIESSIRAAGAQHRVGAGAGVAVFPDDGSSVQELFHFADAALYRSKRAVQAQLAARRAPA